MYPFCDSVVSILYKYLYIYKKGDKKLNVRFLLQVPFDCCPLFHLHLGRKKNTSKIGTKGRFQM